MRTTMKAIHNLLIILSGALLLTACDYLDKEFDASMGEDKIFTSDRLTREFLVNIYLNLPDGFSGYGDSQFYGAPHDVMSDNGQTAWGIHHYNIINDGSFTNQNNPFAWWWAFYYEGIRKCNKFLEESHRAGITDAAVAGDNNRLYTRMRAEARLLRALFHFELCSYFGDVCIVDHVLATDELNRSRDKASDVLKWVMDECDAVKNDLPFNWASEGNWGRVNGALARALKSRASLYRASPLFNTENNREWWKDAADAAQEFITANNSFSGTKYALSPKYDKMFYEAGYNSKEVILARSVWNTWIMDQQCVPMGFAGCNGYGQATQNLVDCYEFTDGTPFDNTSAIARTDPFTDRDPRLDMTVFCNGTTWGVNNTKVEILPGSEYYSANVTYTGYYIRKWCNPEIDYNQDNKARGRTWILYRYAEILLNYAEAINEYEGPSNAYAAVNAVRARADVQMPPYSDLSQAEMQAKIRNERRIELAFEDHRYLDVRRWKLYYNETAHSDMTNLRGVSVARSGPNYTYTYAAYSKGKRVFTQGKHDFFPIPYDQTVKAPLLGQNPGWSAN